MHNIWLYYQLLDTSEKLQEVRKRLKKLGVSKANGPDGISARVLRQCAGALAQSLASLYGFFFKNGMPEGWKIANVVPVHKKKKSARF